MYVYNPFAGNLSETVGATATNAANGAWQQLSYTTPAVTATTVIDFYVDCDGTAGFINVDDWAVNVYNDTRTIDYWGGIGPYVEIDFKNPGATYSFIT
jgi:hypothetical protein